MGAEPELKTFPQGNESPRKMLRLNVRFDSPVPSKEGYQDRGGFWAAVEIWHQEADEWHNLYQKGMRVLLQCRMTYQEWEDKTTGEKRSAFKIEARDVGILPHRLLSIALEPKADKSPENAPPMEEPDDE